MSIRDELHLEQARRITHLAQKVGVARTIDEVCLGLQAFVSESVPCTAIYISERRSPTSDRVTVFEWTGEREEGRFQRPSAADGDTPRARAIRTGRPVFSDDTADPDSRGSPPRSSLAVPLIFQENVLGAVEVQAPGPRAFTEGDAAALSLAADIAATALVNVREIAEREEAEARARFHSHLLDEIGQAVLATDLRGRVTYWNRAAERLFGWTTEEAIGRSTRDVARVFPLRASLDDLRRSVARGEPWEGDIEHLRRDGSRFPAHLNCRPLRNEGDAVVGLVAIVEDLTERQGLEAQLRQSQKTEALGRLASGMAHDFNNLLTAIQGSAELALMEVAADAPHRVDLEEIRRTTERGAALTSQLLTFSRRQVSQPHQIEINAVVETTERMLDRLLGERISVRTALGRNLPAVRFDPSDLEQVLVNLAVNARDAMPEGGVLTLSTTSSMDSSGDPVVILSVADTGEGIDPAIQERIFDPFFTTKPRARGAGLGLSTAAGIVAQAGGRLVVDSRPQKGSTFSVILPASDIAFVPAPESTGASPAGGSETVMVVEDEESVLTLIVRVLRRAGYRVVEARSAEAAIDLIDQGVTPDILVTDAVLPGTSGRALGALLRQQEPRFPVVVVSGHPPEAASPGSPDRFLSKPFDPSALLGSIRQLLDHPTDAGEPAPA